MVIQIKQLALESALVETPITLAFIAELAHTTTVQYAKQIGEDSHLSWGDSPEWVRQSAIEGVAFHILNPEATAEQTHEHWLLKKQEEGWSCGPTKDAERKTHPCMVPYAELPTEHRIKDHLFKAVVDSILDGLQDHGRSLAVEHCGCSMESFTEAARSFWNWLQKDDSSKKPDSRDLEKSDADYFRNKEYSHGEIASSNKKLIERLNWGERALDPSDHTYFTKIANSLYEFAEHLTENGGIRKVMEACSDMVLKAKSEGKINHSEFRKQMGSHLPTLFVPLPEGRALVTGGRFTIEFIGENRPVKRGTERDFIALDKDYAEAISTIMEACGCFKHFDYNNEIWTDEFGIDVDDNESLYNSLSIDWIRDTFLDAATFIINERNTLLKDWADASTKNKE